MSRCPLLLAALFLMASIPHRLTAQADRCTAHQAPTCSSTEVDHPCSPSGTDSERASAESAMMRSHADRMESESRLLETQRMLLRDQQELIQAERSALESAAWQAEWAHRRTEVLVDLLSEGQIECHTVVLSSVTGPLPSESVRNITELLSTHPSLEFVNPLKIRRRYRTHRALDEEFTRRPGVVQLQLHREPLNLHGRFVRVTVTDHTGRLIHEAHHENRHYTEMLDPLLGMGMR